MRQLTEGCFAANKTGEGVGVGCLFAGDKGGLGRLTTQSCNPAALDFTSFFTGSPGPGGLASLCCPLTSAVFWDSTELRICLPRDSNSYSRVG